jgi:cysteine desulfurase
MRRIYLDHAASTPVDPKVLAVMRPYFAEKFGNPGSLHGFGQEAIAALDKAREALALELAADFREVVFTGSATEANNLALRGAVLGWRALHPGVVPKVIVSAIEHESVLETARSLKEEGAEIVELPVSKRGAVDLRALQAAQDERTVLVSVMYGNNETGLMPELSRIFKAVRAKGNGAYPLTHTDASQAFAYFPVRPKELGADLATLSAHKMNGPKGVGLLYIREEVRKLLRPIVTGGGQELGLRSGTENVALIAGFAAAARLAATRRDRERERILGMSRRFWERLSLIRPGAKLNGVDMNEGVTRLPHVLNVHLPGVPAEKALMALDRAGVAISTGSACTSRSSRPSHVLRALGYAESRARESIRVSFGRTTTPADADAAIRIIRSLKL